MVKKLLKKIRYHIQVDKAVKNGDCFNPALVSRKDFEKREYLVSKEDLRRWYPFGLMFVNKEKLFQYHESFGTTGAPTASLLTRRDFHHYVNQIDMGAFRFKKTDFVMIRYPYALSTPAHLFHAAAHRHGSTVVACDSRSEVSPYPRVVHLMKKLDITVLCANPTEAIKIAKFAESISLDPTKDFPSLRAICCAGELLTENQKKYIEKIWSATVFNFYGSTECGNIAYTCECGNLHVAEEYFMLHPQSRAGMNRLILSTLRKEAMPLLKYNTGDYFLYVESCEKACRQRGAVIKIMGREGEWFNFGNKRLLFRDIKDAVFGLVLKQNLSPFWYCTGEGNTIKLTIEKSENQPDIGELSRQLEVDVHLNVVEPGTIVSMESLANVIEVKKPQYFFAGVRR